MSRKQQDILERVKNKKSGANEFVNTISENNNNVKNNNNENTISTDNNNGDNINNNNNNNNKGSEDEEVNNNNDDIIIGTMNDIDIKYNKKKNTKTQTGFYIDADNKRNLDNFAKKYGKGVKSELVNKLLRSFFENNH